MKIFLENNNSNSGWVRIKTNNSYIGEVNTDVTSMEVFYGPHPSQDEYIVEAKCHIYFDTHMTTSISKSDKEKEKNNHYENISRKMLGPIGSKLGINTKDSGEWWGEYHTDLWKVEPDTSYNVYAASSDVKLRFLITPDSNMPFKLYAVDHPQMHLYLFADKTFEEFVSSMKGRDIYDEAPRGYANYSSDEFIEIYNEIINKLISIPELQQSLLERKDSYFEWLAQRDAEGNKKQQNNNKAIPKSKIYQAAVDDIIDFLENIYGDAYDDWQFVKDEIKEVIKRVCIKPVSYFEWYYDPSDNPGRGADIIEQNFSLWVAYTDGTDCEDIFENGYECVGMFEFDQYIEEGSGHHDHGNNRL